MPNSRRGKLSGAPLFPAGLVFPSLSNRPGAKRAHLTLCQLGQERETSPANDRGDELQPLSPVSMQLIELKTSPSQACYGLSDSNCSRFKSPGPSPFPSSVLRSRCRSGSMTSSPQWPMAVMASRVPLGALRVMPGAETNRATVSPLKCGWSIFSLSRLRPVETILPCSRPLPPWQFSPFFSSLAMSRPMKFQPPAQRNSKTLPGRRSR